MRPSYQQGLGRYLQRPRAMLRYDAGLVAAPSDRAKRRFLLRLFKQRNHELLVESGTFLGGTVDYFLRTPGESSPSRSSLVSMRLRNAASSLRRRSSWCSETRWRRSRVCLTGVSEPPLVISTDTSPAA